MSSDAAPSIHPAAIVDPGARLDGFRLVAHPELKLDAGVEDRQERIRLATQELAAVFEEIVRREPAQWHLFQPNWPSDREWIEQRQ